MLTQGRRLFYFKVLCGDPTIFFSFKTQVWDSAVGAGAGGGSKVANGGSGLNLNPTFPISHPLLPPPSPHCLMVCGVPC